MIARRRGRQPFGGANVRFCQNFPKLHEIERIWTRGVPRAPSLDPPMKTEGCWLKYNEFTRSLSVFIPTVNTIPLIELGHHF